MRHFQPGFPKTALDVEALVRLAAVEDGLVAADVLGDEVECLNEAQAQFLALLVLGHRDILDVANETQAVDAMWREKACVSKRYGVVLVWCDCGFFQGFVLRYRPAMNPSQEPCVNATWIVT